MSAPTLYYRVLANAAKTYRSLLLDITASAGWLAFSVLINFYAGSFASEKAGNSVSDVILDNLPALNVSLPFVWGPLLLWLFLAIVLLMQPHWIPFVLKSVALFTLVRSGFIVLTHIGPFPTQSAVDTNGIISTFTFTGDFFFSGHVGSPFLLALIFWGTRWLRYTFLLTSIFFGAIVLIGHLHYSIDVFAAFFITYTIHDLAKFFFAQDLAVFNRGGQRP